jgi:hypothetical protein
MKMSSKTRRKIKMKLKIKIKAVQIKKIRRKPRLQKLLEC